MPLFPPQNFRNAAGIHRLGLASARPNAADVLPGTIYFSTDTVALERSDGTSWAAYALNGGIWTDIPYNAANFSCPGGSWTVDVGDQISFKYIFIAVKTIAIEFAFNTTSVGGAPLNELRFVIPGGYAARTTDVLSTIRSNDNGVDGMGACGCVASATYIRCWAALFANWSVSVNNTTVQGVAMFEVI